MLKRLIRKLFRLRIVSTRYKPVSKPKLDNDFHRRLAAEIGWKRREGV